MVNDQVATNSHLPPPDKVVFEATIPRPAPAAPGAGAPVAFRVLRTTEVDEYEREPSTAAVEPFRPALEPVVDTFAGTSRKAAKLCLSAAKATTFADISAVLESLTPEKTMLPATTNYVRGRDPEIKIGLTNESS